MIQVSDGDAGKWNLALNNAKNLQSDLGAANVDIEIVTYGPGIAMLKADSVVGNRVDEALAAAYAFGLARNDAFVDGNKRIAFHAMMVFLRGNGIEFAPDPAHATTIILSLAAGEVSEESLTRWIRDNWPPESPK